MAVVVCVVLAGFFGVMRRVNVMAVRHMSVVTGFVVVACRMKLGSGTVVPGGLLMMFGGFVVMIGSRLGHRKTSEQRIHGGCYVDITGK